MCCTSGDKGHDDPAMTRERLIELRRDEQRAAAAILGVQRVTFLRLRRWRAGLGGAAPGRGTDPAHPSGAAGGRAHARPVCGAAPLRDLSAPSGPPGRRLRGARCHLLPCAGGALLPRAPGGGAPAASGRRALPDHGRSRRHGHRHHRDVRPEGRRRPRSPEPVGPAPESRGLPPRSRRARRAGARASHSPRRSSASGRADASPPRPPSRRARQEGARAAKKAS